MTLTNIGQGTVVPSSTIASPALSTAYQATVSSEVCGSVTLASTLTAEEVQLQVSATQSGTTGWAIKDRAALTGTVNDGEMLKALVPAGCWFRIVQTTGTTGVTLNSIQLYRL